MAHPCRFLIRTLGCKSNQYESQAMRESLLAAGFAEVARLEEADVLVLNTCAVTARAAASCRHALRRAARLNPALRVAIVGCAVDLGESWPELPSGAPLFLPNRDKVVLPARLKDWLDGNGDFPVSGEISARPALSVSGLVGHSRAFLKIQDGCDNFCSYCAVPLARGKPWSRPWEEIAAEAERLIASGFGELVLTGINIGAWRRGRLDFAGLAERLAGFPGLIRLRFGSLEPQLVDRRLIRVVGDSGGRICPHFHLPLQSGDDRILTAMNRRYSVRDFLDRVDALRNGLDLPAIGADVILGFPGEDDEAFAKTLETCRRAGFSRLHVFPFSPRPGTSAASLPGRPEGRTAESRKSRLVDLGRDMAVDFASRCVGRIERIIVERKGGVSDRYLKTKLKEYPVRLGEAVMVRIVGNSGAELLGRAISDQEAAAFPAFRAASDH